MYGSRDPKSRLWRVDLKQKFEKQEVQCNHAHDNNNQKSLNKLSACCMSQSCQINLDHGYKKWKFLVLAMSNRACYCCCKSFVQICRDYKRTF
jgi:hypothetical protein